MKAPAAAQDWPFVKTTVAPAETDTQTETDKQADTDTHSPAIWKSTQRKTTSYIIIITIAALIKGVAIYYNYGAE